MMHPPGTPVRPATVAGSFYPADPAELEASARSLLSRAVPVELDIRPTLLIVPHAGYIYSGPIAATAYLLFEKWAPSFARLLLVGPAHFIGFQGLALPGALAFATPLGTVPIDNELARMCATLSRVSTHALAHRNEHSLEVQLPFLQIVAPGLPFVPLLTGDDDPGPATEAIEAAVSLGDVAVLVSSDLSHYLEYEAAVRCDRRTAAAIGALDPDPIGRDAACGRTGILAALAVARRHAWGCRTVDLRNSGDTAGDRHQVVGYGAFALGPELM